MNDYGDIINLPHHVSKKHAPMDMIKRAAQFAPFAALTGYDAAVEEAARVTEDMISLSEDEVGEINRVIGEAIDAGKEICLRYFEPDKNKDGGEDRTIVGTIRKIENGMIKLDDGKRIKVDFIVGAEMAAGV